MNSAESDILLPFFSIYQFKEWLTKKKPVLSFGASWTIAPGVSKKNELAIRGTIEMVLERAERHSRNQRGNRYEVGGKAQLQRKDSLEDAERFKTYGRSSKIKSRPIIDTITLIKELAHHLKNFWDLNQVSWAEIQGTYDGPEGQKQILSWTFPRKEGGGGGGGGEPPRPFAPPSPSGMQMPVPMALTANYLPDEVPRL